jgi:hypothetical protein
MSSSFAVASHVGLTERQATFALRYVDNGGNARQAALAAGYALRSAAKTGFELKQHPGIQTRIEQLTRKLLGTHAPLAVATLVNVMQDPEANAMARVRAAEILLDRAGFKPIERYEDVSKPGSLDVDALKARAQELLEELRLREMARGEP